MTPTGDLLTASQVAELLGKDVSSVNRLAAAGRLPVVQKLPGLRGARLFNRAAIEEICQRREFAA